MQTCKNITVSQPLDVVHVLCAGKVFPKLRRRGRPVRTKSDDSDAEESVDYVFQIINKMSHREFRKLMIYSNTVSYFRVTLRRVCCTSSCREFQDVWITK